MQGYCARCHKDWPEIPEAILTSGQCPDCSGQVTSGDVSVNKPVAGAVAMTFQAGSLVGTSMTAQAGDVPSPEESGAAPPPPPDDASLPPPPPDDAVEGSSGSDDDGDDFDIDDDADSSKPPSVLEDEPSGATLPSHLAFGADPFGGQTQSGESDVDSNAAADNSVERDSPFADAPFSAQKTDGDADAGALENQQSTSEDTSEEVEAPAPPPSESFQDDSDSDGDTGADAPAGGDATPAHLQLPSIDFSLPDEAAGDASSGFAQSESAPVAPPSDATSSTSSADLPAHLQLPSFPDFALPPVPGEEDGSAQAPGEPGAQARAGHGGVAPPPLVPPKLPKKPPSPPKANTNALADAGFLPDLPDLGGPEDEEAADHRRNPTLIHSDAAEALAGLNQSPFRRAVLPVTLVILLGAGVATAWVHREELKGMFVEKKELPQKDKDLRALELVAQGREAFKEEKNDEAIKAFKQALKLGRTQAHRNLGIVYATLKKNDQAVKHYRKYIEHHSDADDAAEVKKILSKYDEKNEEKSEDKSKKRNKRRRRR